MHELEKPSLQDLLGGSLVWDNHACMPLRPGDWTYLRQLEAVRSAGTDVISINLGYGDCSIDDVLAMAESVENFVAANSDKFCRARNTTEIEAARGARKLAILFDLEGVNPLEGDLSRVALLQSIGVRWMLAAYNKNNAAGGGCLDDDRGLTPFGRTVVAEMNRVGIVPCASHCGYRTARDLIDASETPVIFSHSNSRALCDHPRNIPDDLLRACAERGGVVGLCGFGPFLGSPELIRAFVDQASYVVDLIGDDHVGIALDYVFDRAELDHHLRSSPDLFPSAFYHTGAPMIAPWDLADICKAMMKRGFPLSTLRKLFGANHLRIAQLAWC